jgi:hypothetical protein
MEINSSLLRPFELSWNDFWMMLKAMGDNKMKTTSICSANFL